MDLSSYDLHYACRAKYPLAIIAKVIEVLPEKCLNGYDIGCEFEKTVRASSLGPAWMARGCRCCVNAFHGCSHNYWCQLNHHPNVIDGMGLEDLETLERIFSSSNQLASTTRYSSAYRRRLAIDQYFQQWDADKYSNISLMLYNNLIQAQKILQSDAEAMEEAMSAKNLSVDMLRAWHTDEREYFRTLGHEPPWDIHAMAYVENLQELRSVRAQLQKDSAERLRSIPDGYAFAAPETGPIDYAKAMSSTRTKESQRRYFIERERTLAVECAEMELQMGIAKTWEPTDAPYQETMRYMANRTYERALDNLQRLVVQRLFELHRMNLSQTGKCFWYDHELI